MYLTYDAEGWCLWQTKPEIKEVVGIYTVNMRDGRPFVGIISKPTGYRVPKSGRGMWKVKLNTVRRMK
jgi:hypothetical protein